MGTSLFSLEEHISKIALAYPKQFACRARTLKEYQSWQMHFRKELTCLLGLQGRHPAQYTDTFISATDRGNYIEEKHALAIRESVSIPIYLLIPKTKSPHSVILVFHGHDPSVQYCLGNVNDAQEAQRNVASDNNYARILAEAGYLVCVVVQRGLDERLTGQVDEQSGRSCRHLAFSYLNQGRTLMGERVWDGMITIDYLKSRPDVHGKLGCTGHSAGGATALWLAALDRRIEVSVISAYFSSFANSIYAMPHCECNYVPGAGAAFEMGDLAVLLAPNALCLINGQRDEIFPVQAARNQYETVKQIYALHGADEACDLFVHDGGHRYQKEKALSWFAAWMN